MNNQKEEEESEEEEEEGEEENEESEEEEGEEEESEEEEEEEYEKVAKGIPKVQKKESKEETRQDIPKQPMPTFPASSQFNEASDPLEDTRMKHLLQSSGRQLQMNNSLGRSFGSGRGLGLIPLGAEEAERHYRVSVDLKSVREMTFGVPYLYVKYSYPLFGGDSPVYTHPPLLVKPVKEHSGDIPLPNAFCLFEFALKKGILQSSLESVPLVLEVMDKGRSTYDKKIGLVNIDLTQLLNAPERPSGVGSIRVFDAWCPILSMEDEYYRIGLLRVVVTLEDIGPVGPLESRSMGSRNPTEGTLQSPTVIWELEKWKREQKEKWKQRLRKKEEAYVKRLQEEWNRRISEQEAQAGKRFSECAQLENKLKLMVSGLEKREQKLFMAEEELNRLRATGEDEHKRNRQEVEAAQQRSQRELEHFKEIEKMRSQVTSLSFTHHRNWNARRTNWKRD